MGEYLLIWAHFFFTWLRFSVWWLQNSRKMTPAPWIWIFTINKFLQLTEYIYIFSHISLSNIFFHGFWLKFGNFYFTLLRFSVLLITKYNKNGSRSINMKNFRNFCHPSSIVLIPLSHMAFYVFFWVSIGIDLLLYISHYSNSFPWWSQNCWEMALPSKIYNCHNYFLSCFRVWILFSHGAFGVFICSYCSG